MKKLLLFILFPFATKAEVQIDYVQGKDGREYYLTSENCQEIIDEMVNFKSLMENYSKSTKLHKLAECDNGSRIHSVSIKGLIPANMEKLLNTSVQYYGPNCWNSVIYANGLTSAIHFYTPLVFTKTLSYYQCATRSAGEKLQAGDIIRIQTVQNKIHDEFHAFIYISPTFSFSKNGPETRSTYNLDKTLDIFKSYGVPSLCFDSKNQLINPECEDVVKVHNCQKRVEPNHPNPDGLWLMINEIEVRLTYLILNYRNFPSLDARSALIHDLEQKLSSVYFIINNDLSNGKLDAETFAREDFYFSKVLTMKEQLSYF